MADELSGTPGATPEVQVPETATPAPLPAVESPQTAQPQAAPAYDIQADIGALRNENAQWRDLYSRQMEEQAKSQKAFQENMLRTFAPDLYKQQAAPRYITTEQFQEYQTNLSKELQTRQEASMFHSELASAKEKFPNLFSRWSKVENHILSIWSNNPDRSVTDIASEFDSTLAKAFEAQQAQVVAGKDMMQQKIKGGPVKTGGAPEAQDSGLRGKARLMAIRLGKTG